MVEKTKLESEEEFLASLLPGGERGEPGTQAIAEERAADTRRGNKAADKHAAEGPRNPWLAAAMPFRAMKTRLAPSSRI